MLQISEYVGIPYSAGGNSDYGIDCYNLVRRFYKDRLDIDLPEVFNPADFEIIDPAYAEEYDIIAFTHDMRWWQHVMVYIGDGYVLHANNQTYAVQADVLRELASDKTIAYVGGFRWKKD